MSGPYTHFDTSDGRTACDKPSQRHAMPLPSEPRTVVAMDVTCPSCLHSPAMQGWRDWDWWKERVRG